MAKTKQMMETDDKGIERQFFPVTHAGAVLGLKEFLEGDFFQADFDRVMALLEERSDKAFAEIDKKSEAMEKHADEKITEFDNKIAATNQTLATLEKEIYDTQQTFENMDVFNKQESSTNVINQVIGKESSDIKLTLDFQGKIQGSLVENPHQGMGTNSTTLVTPTNFADNCVQNAYNDIAIHDGKTRNVPTTKADSIAQMVFKFNVLEDVKRELGEKFFIDRGAINLDERVELLRNILTIQWNVWGFGSGPSGFKFNVGGWSNTGSWTGIGTHPYGSVNRLSNKTTSSNNKYFIDNLGYTHIIAFAEASDGTTNSAVSVDYANLDITIDISVNEHIKSMMAAYHRENEKYTFEKVGEV